MRLKRRLIIGCHIMLLALLIVLPTSVAALSPQHQKYFSRGIFYAEPASNPTSEGCGNFSGENNTQIAFNFLKSRGLDDTHAAAIVGSLLRESSSLDPKAVQLNGDGRGIAQWDKDDRWQNLQTFAESRRKDPLTIELQLEFLWFEYTGQPPTPGLSPDSIASNSYEEFLATTNLEEAVRLFTQKFERAGVEDLPARVGYAEETLADYGGQNNSPCTCTESNREIDCFPLTTSKRDIQEGVDGATWCYEATTNCHHDYNAADIHAEVGVAVVATKEGKVVSATDEIGGAGSRVTIIGGDGRYTYYYAHMTFGSLSVQVGDKVNVGQKLGTVGESQQAMGTAPHLHIDVLPQAEYQTRPGCSSAECTGYPFVDIQPFLKTLYDTVLPN